MIYSSLVQRIIIYCSLDTINKTYFIQTPHISSPKTWMKQQHKKIHMHNDARKNIVWYHPSEESNLLPTQVLVNRFCPTEVYQVTVLYEGCLLMNDTKQQLLWRFLGQVTQWLNDASQYETSNGLTQELNQEDIHEMKNKYFKSINIM